MICVSHCATLLFNVYIYSSSWNGKYSGVFYATWSSNHFPLYVWSLSAYFQLNRQYRIPPIHHIERWEICARTHTSTIRKQDGFQLFNIPSPPAPHWHASGEYTKLFGLSVHPSHLFVDDHDKQNWCAVQYQLLNTSCSIPDAASLKRSWCSWFSNVCPWSVWKTLK